MTLSRDPHMEPLRSSPPASHQERRGREGSPGPHSGAELPPRLHPAPWAAPKSGRSRVGVMREDSDTSLTIGEGRSLIFSALGRTLESSGATAVDPNGELATVTARLRGQLRLLYQPDNALQRWACSTSSHWGQR